MATQEGQSILATGGVSGAEAAEQQGDVFTGCWWWQSCS